MGHVYEVVDEELGATYALKLTQQHCLGPLARERFRKEARAMVELDHPNIVRFYTYGEHEDVPYYTMRLLRGGTLATGRKTGPDANRHTVALVLKVVAAIAYLHDRGFVHRDLKPRNILLDEAGEPYVSDFGLVKSLQTDFAVEAMTGTPAQLEPTSGGSGHGSGDTEALTAPGSVMGTRGYMSPEQSTGDVDNIGPKSDIWSLGIILYDALVGMMPFQHPDPAELTRRIRVESPPIPSAIQKDFDPRLEHIVLKCLEKDPARRFTARELYSALNDWLNPAPRDTRSWPRRHLGLLIPMAVCLLAVGIVVWLRPRPIHPPPPPPSIAEVREKLRANVARGDKVQLVSEDGKLTVPLTYLFNGELARSITVGDDCTLDSTAPLYAEVLDDVGVENYSFHVEVKCTPSMARPAGGLFFAHQSLSASPGATHHFLGEMRFIEPIAPAAPAGGQRPPAEAAKFEAKGTPDNRGLDGVREAALRRYTVPTLDGKITTSKSQLPLPDAKLSAKTDKPDWRTLGVEARPAEYRLTWNGQPIGTIVRPIANTPRLGLTAGLGTTVDRQKLFSTPGGIGFVVQGGTVSFRNADIQLRND